MNPEGRQSYNPEIAVQHKGIHNCAGYSSTCYACDIDSFRRLTLASSTQKMSDSDTSSQYADSEASTPRVGIYYSSEEEGEIEHVSKKPRFAPKYRERDYELVKQQFELTHFKCKTQFYSLNAEGKWEVYGQIGFRTKEEDIQYDEEVYNKKTKSNKTEVKCFINTWFKDDTKRQYDKVQCLPPPLHVPANTFNLWNGFALSKLAPATEDEKLFYAEPLTRVLSHLHAVAADNDTNYQYLLNWIASILQLPGTKTKIMPVIKSVEKGVGKGVFKDIMNALIGTEYCYHTSNPSKQLFGQFNNTLKDKLFITFDEANQSSLASIIEELKSMITESTQNIRMLFKEMEEGSPSFVNVCLLTNRDISWEHGDRRPLYLDMSPKFKGNHEHFTSLCESLKDKRFMRVLFEYFTERDISKVVLERDRPVTDLHKSMEQRSSPMEIQFLINLGFHDDRLFYDAAGNELKEFKITSKDLHRKYMNYMDTYKDYKPMNNILFGIKIHDRIKEGMMGVVKGRCNKGMAYSFQVKEFKKWLIHSNYYTDEKNLKMIEGVDTTIGFFFDSDRN
jgi:hypothetical protein